MERPAPEAVFDANVEAGGNIVDIANVYASGRSEEMVGGIIADRKYIAALGSGQFFNNATSLNNTL